MPDPDGSREEQPSVAFDQFSDKLRGAGLEPSWNRTYNAGANPISLRLTRPDLLKLEVQDLLWAPFEILEPGAASWLGASGFRGIEGAPSLR